MYLCASWKVRKVSVIWERCCSCFCRFPTDNADVGSGDVGAFPIRGISGSGQSLSLGHPLIPFKLSKGCLGVYLLRLLFMSVIYVFALTVVYVAFLLLSSVSSGFLKCSNQIGQAIKNVDGLLLL